MAEDRFRPQRDADRAEHDSATAVANHAVTSEEELTARLQQQALLVEVNATLAAAIEAEAVLGQVLSRLVARVGLVKASLYLLDPERRQLRCVAQSGLSGIERYRTYQLDGQGLTAWVARSGEAVYVPEADKEPRCVGGDARTKSQYAVPLRAGSSVLGVLEIESNREGGIRAVTRKLADQFASQTALALERSDLYKKLRASEERFRSIFEQGHLGVALCDLEGRFFTVNPAFGQILGYAPGELTGMTYAEVTHPQDRRESAERVRQLMAGKTHRFTMEKRYLRKSGEPVWCMVIVSLLRDSAGRPAYTLAMLQDISERKKAEEERARLHEQLFHAQKMEAIGTLAGGIAHDFNNLLGVILGYASLVQTRLQPGDPLQEPLQMMEQSAERAAALIHQLLQFARQGLYQMKHVDPREILERVLKIVTQTFNRRIRVEPRLASQLPSIEGDPGQLELVVLNLCINARDAMPEGGVLTLESSVVTLGPGDALRPAECAPGEYVQIVIRDTGVGMEPELMQRIFEPFFSTKEPAKGSGLGLAMVYGTVKRHRGFLHVASQPGRGSEFRLYLPSASGRLDPAERGADKQPPEGEIGAGTVLVVDDEPLMQSFAEDALIELGYKVLIAGDGAMAKETYARRAAEIDWVLLDMVTPGMSWRDTYEALRAINPQVRVILSSGYSGGGEDRTALEAGAVAFLAKPYSVEELARVLKGPPTDADSDKEHRA
jgi:two-component system cell cycle sensor histidine kinase/response regulator CckA